MATIRVSASGLGQAMKAEIVRRLRAGRLDQILVDNARTRINNRGDSTEKYPELWATRTGLGYRAGGQPLRDTGVLFNSLTSDSEPTGRGLRMRLIDGSPDGRGVKHQSGFVNKAPVFVPLTRRAARHSFEGLGFKAMRVAAIAAGLVEGRQGDFIVLRRDAVVPARKIHNTAPEDVQAIVHGIRDLIGAA